MSNLAQRRSPVGFTLLELLVGAAITTLIVAGLGEAFGLFGRQVEAVRAETDKGPEEALALMTDMARYGWSVEHPAEGQLDIVDALGERTSFAVVDGELRVTRPSGASGELLEGVASLSIDTDTVRRLRDGEPVDDHRTWWQAPAPAGAPVTLALESGLSAGLGFTMASAVPDDYDVVDDIDEHALFGTLETLVLSMSYVGEIPDDPNEPIAGEESGGSGKKRKVTICHVPPGNPENAHTLSISESAVPAHLAHGDWLGTCEAPPDTQVFPDVTIELYEARAPEDGRPVGEPLASMTLVSLALPVGSASWVLTETGSTGHSSHDHGAEECDATTPDGKVVICHVPPGNPANAHSITIAPAAVPAHLAHGDYYGCCGEHDESEDLYTLVIDAEPAEIALDLSPLGAVILPGRAYTLVLSLSGPGTLHVGAVALGQSGNSGVAQAVSAYGDLEPAALSVPFHLQGMQRITQTDEHEPISRVSLTLAMADGQSVSGSASVTSQASVPGIWLGAVPGQMAELDP